VAKKYSLNPQPQLLKMYGFDKPMSRSPLILPFPGAMGVETPTGVVPNPMSQMYNQLLQFEEERALLYSLYDEMELDPTIYSYLEQLTEDATQRDARRGVTVWCESQNKDIERTVNAMLAQTGLSDEMAQPIMRSIAKWGDDFEFVMAEAKEGVTRLIHYHPATISRVHDEYGRLRGFTPYQSEDVYTYGVQASKAKNIELMSKPWDFLHFRRLGRSISRVYGTSMLYGARRVWRQVQMMEDKVALMRLLRQVDRYKHKIDTTGLGPVDADAKLEKYRRSVKRDFNFAPDQLDFASVYALIAENEDLFLTVRKDDQSDIELLAGTKGLDDLRDLEMFLDRMFGALRAPKGYFGFEGNANFERTPSQQDVRFAKQAGTLQRIFLTEVTRLAMMDLMYKGINPLLEENVFTLFMVPPSSLEELYRLETLDARVRSLETLARIGNTLNVDEASWLEVVLSEFPLFTRAFTDTVVDALHRLRATGATGTAVTQEVLKDEKVQQALNEERKSSSVDWKMSSNEESIRIPKDLAGLIEKDERDKDERVKFRNDFAEALEAAEKERADRVEAEKAKREESKEPEPEPALA
jgi:hypothetical protein